MEESEEKEEKRPNRRPAVAWAAVVLALVAWLLLAIGYGYGALAAGILGFAGSIWSCSVNYGALRKLSIAGMIVSGVLVIVVGAFIVAVKSL